jgi:hypothetical protein
VGSRSAPIGTPPRTKFLTIFQCGEDDQRQGPTAALIHILLAWQVIRAATQPDIESTSWRIGDVLCRRHRHRASTPDHSLVGDICHIECRGGLGGWHLVVSVGNMWDSQRNIVRSQLWASHITGWKENALAWMHREAAAREFSPGPPSQDAVRHSEAPPGFETVPGRRISERS